MPMAPPRGPPPRPTIGGIPPRVPPPPPPGAVSPHLLPARPLYASVATTPSWRPPIAPPLPRRPPWPAVPFNARPPPPPHRPLLRPSRQSTATDAARDRNARWLREFCERHLTTVVTMKNEPFRDAPLMRLRQRLSAIVEKIEVLERHAAELGTLERRLAESAEHSVEAARLAVQLERKRATCAALQREIETESTPRPVGISLDELAAIEAHARRVQAKQRGRRNSIRRLRAEAAIARGLNARETAEAVSDDAVDTQTTMESLNASVDSTTHIETVHAAEKHPEGDRDAARKLLLAIRLKEKRRGATLSEGERVQLLAARDAALACLGVSTKVQERKRRRRRVRQPIGAAIDSHTQTTNPVPSHSESRGCDPTSDRRLPLMAPDQIDMQTLIAVRRAWDLYLAPPHIIGATSIPPHYVVPPSQPSQAWQPFLVENGP